MALFEFLQGSNSAVPDEVCYGGLTATTVGAAGGASALPATPTGYVIINVAGTNVKLPYLQQLNCASQLTSKFRNDVL